MTSESLNKPNDVFPDVLPTVFPCPVHWPSVFEREAPLEVDLGFGPPHYLLDRAQEVPEKDIVGIEWKKRFINDANEKSSKRGISNLRAIYGNAWLLFGAMFSPESLDAVHLNCPDPWWKSKHRKRRILSDTFINTVVSRLRPGGVLFVQTDVASLLEVYLERMEAHEETPTAKDAFA